MDFRSLPICLDRMSGDPIEVYVGSDLAFGPPRMRSYAPQLSVVVQRLQTASTALSSVLLSKLKLELLVYISFFLIQFFFPGLYQT
jgi:hypothetical protein